MLKSGISDCGSIGGFSDRTRQDPGPADRTRLVAVAGRNPERVRLAAAVGCAVHDVAGLPALAHLNTAVACTPGCAKAAALMDGAARRQPVAVVRAVYASAATGCPGRVEVAAPAADKDEEGIL